MLGKHQCADISDCTRRARRTSSRHVATSVASLHGSACPPGVTTQVVPTSCSPVNAANTLACAAGGELGSGQRRGEVVGHGEHVLRRSR